MIKGIALPIAALLGLLYFSLHRNQPNNEREKLSAIINSEYQEVRPLISADGNTLYFCRRNHPENIGGTSDFQDVWMSHQVNGEWSQPTNLGAPINNKKANTICSISADGKYAFFLDSYRQVKTPLSASRLTAEGWEKPKEIEIEDFTNLSSYYDFHMHETEGVLLMAINTGRGSGDQDLHVSFLEKDGKYSKPLNLGRVLNSRQADFAPFLSADSKTLFFASYGHGGQGGSDLFISHRLDDSWRKWSAPVNLGPTINSADDENYVSVTADQQYVYFESYPKGSKEKDIYRARMPVLSGPENLQEQVDEETLPVTADNQMGQETAVPQPEPQKPQPAVSTGKSLQRPVAQYAGRIGKLAVKEHFQAGTVRSKVLNNLYFPFNSYQVPSSYLEQLREISKILQDQPAMEAYIEGHTDSWGSDNVNLNISLLRAQKAAHYLVGQGIASKRLHISGLGEHRPLASNDDELEGRELNRRVEIILQNAAGVQLLFILHDQSQSN